MRRYWLVIAGVCWVLLWWLVGALAWLLVKRYLL